MLDDLRDLWHFLLLRKKLWLLPVIVLLVVISLFVFLIESSAVAPFIYSLF